MQTGPQILQAFAKANSVDMQAYHEWFADGGYPQEEANHHDSRALARMEQYVEERGAL